MRKTAGTLAVILLSILGQSQSGMRCHEGTYFWKNQSVIFTVPQRICEFSDGRVNTTKTIGNTYESGWFTSEQWKIESEKQRAIEKKLLQEEVTCRLYIREGNKPPTNLNCQRPLEEWSKTPGPPLK